VGTLSADFGYAGYYVHGPSGLNLTTHRAYSPSLGRWINRDPIGERGGINLYDYVSNRPTEDIDPSGLITFSPCYSKNCCFGNREKCHNECTRLFNNGQIKDVCEYEKCRDCCDNAKTHCFDVIPTGFPGSFWESCFKKYGPPDGK
jgi:RHS repeat-associated protein